MWSLSIKSGNPLLRLIVHDKRIRTAALACAALLALDIILYSALVAPAASRLASGEARSQELRKRHAVAVLYTKQKPSFSGMMAGIPEQKDMPLLVKDLVQTARRMNLSVSSVKYDIPKRASGELTLLAFSFPAEGRYGNVKRFIHDVETSDRIVGIQDLKMDSEKGTIKLELKLLTYVRGQ
jgi:Tfp pilus assembly protein PilO